MVEFIGGRTWQMLTKGLAAAGLRQRVIAHNIANVNTPGFKKYDVTFEEELRAALADSPFAPRLEAVEPRVVQEPTQTAAVPDGNNVDLNEEMIKLAANTLNYQLLAQAVSGRLANLRYVISGGRR